MTIADILGIVCLPMAALGLLIAALYSRRRPARSQSDVVVWVIVFMIGAPLFAVTFIYKNESELLAFDSDVFYAVFGVAWMTAMWKRIDFTATPSLDLLTVLIGVGCIGIGGWYLVGDFLMSRLHVVEVVANTYTTRGKAGVYYHVVLGAGHYQVTGDLFGHLRIGDRIDAEIGRASDMIFRIKTLSASASLRPHQ